MEGLSLVSELQLAPKRLIQLNLKQEAIYIIQVNRMNICWEHLLLWKFNRFPILNTTEISWVYLISLDLHNLEALDNNLDEQLITL